MTETITSWHRHLLDYFAHKDSAMLLVIDPDLLLRDDELLAEIENRNYDVLELQEEVAFRNLFERIYRSRWDSGEDRHVVVIVHTADQARHIPYDLWQKSKRIELSVAALFPNLNAIVVAGLDNAYYATLYPAHQQLVARNEMLRGESQTVEFILRAVFNLDPMAALDTNRLVELLIQKHQRGLRIPGAVQNELKCTLLPRVHASGISPDFVDDAPAFYDWLGGQWQAYLQLEQKQGSAPAVDFGDARLRTYWSALFTLGLLPRQSGRGDSLGAGREWLSVGLVEQTDGERKTGEDLTEKTMYHLRARLAHLRSLEPDNLPTGKSDLRDWLNLAAEWAEVVYLANHLPGSYYAQIQAEFAQTRQVLDNGFWKFVQERYSAIDHYQDNKGPISLAAINRWLYQALDKSDRLALICFDGMALDQWRLLRSYLERKITGLAFQENSTYAVAPTITPVSRQALFAGRPPAGFPESISSTSKDADRWRAFWINHDVLQTRVAHVAVKVTDSEMNELRALIETKQRLAILVNLFDDSMHATTGMAAVADKRIYYATLNSQLFNSHLDQLFERLLQHGYRVWVTSDHGNIMGIGNGLTPPKALIESYARRVVIFDQATLAQEYAQALGLRCFRTKSLPADIHPVYLPGNQMLDIKNATGITHGGLSLEELVVPFVEVRRS